MQPRDLDRDDEDTSSRVAVLSCLFHQHISAGEWSLRNDNEVETPL